MKNKNNIIITGATGFLGSHILKHFIKYTDYNFIVLKRSFSNDYRIKQELNNSRVQAFDIDKINLEDVFKTYNNKILSIIHCATDYGRNTTCANVLQTNLIFPIRLLELAIENNCLSFINTDSYFNKENFSYLYLQNYSLSKKSLNLWLKNFASNIKIINLILEHIYGSNDNSNKFTQSMIKNIAIDKIKEIDCTYGDQERDFIYVSDVCKAYEIALNYSINHQFRYKTFNVGTGKTTSIKLFINLIKEISKSDSKINFGKLPYRKDEIMLSCADNLELLDLGWKPLITLKEGIAQYIREEKINETTYTSSSNI